MAKNGQTVGERKKKLGLLLKSALENRAKGIYQLNGSAEHVMFGVVLIVKKKLVSIKMTLMNVIQTP